MFLNGFMWACAGVFGSPTFTVSCCNENSPVPCDQGSVCARAVDAQFHCVWSRFFPVYWCIRIQLYSYTQYRKVVQDKSCPATHHALKARSSNSARIFRIVRNTELTLLRYKKRQSMTQANFSYYLLFLFGKNWSCNHYTDMCHPCVRVPLW